jgi:ABC-2 type transport system permease protein
VRAVTETATDTGIPFAGQVFLLTRRFVRNLIRQPAVLLPNLGISVFFLLVYYGSFGDSPAVVELTGGNYLNFVLPVTVLFASISGGAAGLTLVEDLESGYFRRLLAMPLARTAIVLSAMILGALQVTVEAVLIIGVGLILGADPVTGAPGLLAVLFFSLLWGLGFAGYSVATGLLTGNARAAQSATFIFFPLLFLAPVFLPFDQLSPWIQAIARVNPTTYMLEGMRSLMIDGWVAWPLGKAMIAGSLFAGVTLLWAARVAVRKTSRA